MIDSDQHLFEPRTLWADHMDPGMRDRALAIVDDSVGNAWLTWRGERIVMADVTLPGQTREVGERLQRALAGEAPAARYDEILPSSYWDPDARVAVLPALGVDESVLFPNYGLTWERTLEADLGASLANMGAWNRWAIAVAQSGRGVLHPVAHLSLRDLGWLDTQLAALARGGVRLAMISPGLVDGKPLSHPDLDGAWAAFVHHGVTPVFHVENVTRPFDDAWFASDPEPTNPALGSVFLWAGPALAIADLTVNATFQRHPELRLGVMELSAVWLPMFLMYLDGGVAFHERLHGAKVAELAAPPSEYVRRHVRIAAFSYEDPDRLARSCGDLFMSCSDWPHSEGTATPAVDYGDQGASTGLHRANIDWVLHRD